MTDKSDAGFRFTVDVSRNLADEIERLADESGRSKGEVFTFAIGLLSAACSARNEGMNVGAWNGNGPARKFVNF